MRDPDGSLAFEGPSVVRTFRVPVADGHFLRSALAARWVHERRLVPFERLDDRTYASPRLPFVSYPQEWCDEQLWDAAALTLALHDEAVAAGFDLKDASAWNILFDRGQPVLCDHGSLLSLTTTRWWAAGQYGRHFLLPLLLSRTRGLHARQSFMVWRDGVPPEAAAALLGWRRFLSRYWPLTSAGSGVVTGGSDRVASLEQMQRFRERIGATLRWMLQGVAARDRAGPADWSRYTDHRDHYPGSSLQTKRETVARWLTALSPGWVVDLGCNTGEFSRLALDAGASVIAIDSDHASVQALHRSAREGRPLHPVIASLDDLPGGRGWMATEHEGLVQRIAPLGNLVLMLALVHHLAVANAVPMAEVARFAATITRRWLVLELIGEHDPQMKLLCGQRQRDPSAFGMAQQLAAFVDAGFSVEQRVELAPAARALVLLRAPAQPVPSASSESCQAPGGDGALD